ncbi:MAG: FAD/NAD(P)-binding protein [Gammaproteobacteria bacterium]
MREAAVAIVGGGFCGTLAAIRLLTAPVDGRGPRRVVMVETARPGQGLAYAPGPEYWRLNVTAARMSAFGERPADFLDWARERHAETQGDDYLPRAWYGDYLADRLDHARKGSSHRFEQVRARATAFTQTPGGALITLSDGSTLMSGAALLAPGNSPDSGAVAGLAPDCAVANPWSPDWLEALPAQSRVLLIGTGLTMIDIALHVAARRPSARMLAISRHGLLPRTQSVPWSAGPLPAAADVMPLRGTLRERLRSFRRWIDGRDWHLALQSVREVMPELWRDAPEPERRRFLRHLRSIWDVHRHRSPPSTFARIQALQQDGRLRVVAGRLLATRRDGTGVTATWRPRGAHQRVEETVDAIVNVSGPESDLRRSANPLVQSLLSGGLCRPDALRLGWDTAADGSLIAADGQPARNIHYVGPGLRARFWEATAVPELRGHVDRMVAAIRIANPRA